MADRRWEHCDYDYDFDLDLNLNLDLDLDDDYISQWANW